MLPLNASKMVPCGTLFLHPEVGMFFAREVWRIADVLSDNLSSEQIVEVYSKLTLPPALYCRNVLMSYSYCS